MKSAVLHKVGKITVEERAVPKPGAAEALVKVMACGICGTDVHIFEGDKGAADNPLPIVLGHEFAGVVQAVGSGVHGVAVGARVCVDPNVLCGHCTFCKGGLGHFCENMVGIGTTVDGGFSGYCVVPFQQLYPLAPTTSFDEGAMAEPLACCLHGIDLCEISAGDTVVVIGGGMIGLLMLQLAKGRGAARVILVEPVAAKREAATKLGCDLCLDPLAADVATELEKHGVARVNTVIECVGKPATIRQAIQIAGKKSVVMMFGLTKPDEEVAILPYEIFKKEVVLKASFINPYTMGRAVELINTRKIDVRSMVTARIPLKALGQALADGALRSQGKVLVHPWAE